MRKTATKVGKGVMAHLKLARGATERLAVAGKVNRKCCHLNAGGDRHVSFLFPPPTRHSPMHLALWLTASFIKRHVGRLLWGTVLLTVCWLGWPSLWLLVVGEIVGSLLLDLYRSQPLVPPAAHDSKRPHTLYAHGLHSTPEQFFHWTRQTVINGGRTTRPMVMNSRLFSLLPLVPDDSPSWASPAAPWPALSIGYGADVSIFQTDLERVLESTANPLVLFGFSRGTATVLNTLARMGDKKLTGRIKGVILLGAFASAGQVIDFRIKSNWLWRWAWPVICHVMLGMYGPEAVNPDNAPIASVSDVPSNIPITIVASLADRDVPYASAVDLYEALRTAGKNAVLVTLKNTPHEMATAEGEDRRVLEDLFARVYG